MIGDSIFRRPDWRLRGPFARREASPDVEVADVPVKETVRVVVPTTKWSPRDWRAMIALWASIAGAGIITGLVIWTVRMVRAIGLSSPLLVARALDAIANFTYGLLLILGAILLSLGLAINRRSFAAKAFGASIEASGGARHPDEPS